METQTIAEQRLGRYLTEGREKSAKVIGELQHEAEQRVDVLIPRKLMDFQVTSDDVRLTVQHPQLPAPLGFTQWSRSQMLSNLGVPERFVSALQSDGDTGTHIAARLLNDLRYRIGGEQETNGKSRRLLRVVSNEVRGWLSPTYGMFDQSEIIGGFAQAIAQTQNVYFTDGVISDRRYGVTAIYAKILEPFPGEFIILGVQLQSSDYGFGAVDLLQQVIRLVCKNGAIGVSFFRKVHRGTGYGGEEDHLFEVSEKTRQLGASATVSLLTDAVKGVFAENAIEKALGSYRASAAKEINPLKEMKDLRERGIVNKEESSVIPALLDSDVEFLPKTPSNASSLRFGQLLAWMAGQNSGEKQITLMETAGKYL